MRTPSSHMNRHQVDEICAKGAQRNQPQSLHSKHGFQSWLVGLQNSNIENLIKGKATY